MSLIDSELSNNPMCRRIAIEEASEIVDDALRELSKFPTSKEVSKLAQISVLFKQLLGI